MGTWHLEVLRMAVYISFPIGIFHYINQPENYENYIMKVRETVPGPCNKTRLKLKQHIKEANDRSNEKHLRLMEERFQMKESQK